MQTEIEAKFLSTDHAELRKKLEESGAKRLHKKRLMRRRNFDYPDNRLEKIGGWIRVRDEGDKISLSYKQLNERSLHGTQEVNLVVNDFEVACRFLESIGFEQKSYQETKRESWELDGAQIELDEWPWVESFSEIEAPDEVTIRKVAAKLGFDLKQALHGSVENVYQAEYNVSEKEIDSWPEIKFVPVPEWLTKRRK